MSPQNFSILSHVRVLPEFSRQSFRRAAASGRFPSLNAISNRFQRDFLFSVDIFLLRLVKLFKLAFRSTDAVEFASFFLNETCRNRRGRREARLRPRKFFRKFLSFRRRSGDIFRDDGIVATAARRFRAFFCQNKKEKPILTTFSDWARDGQVATAAGNLETLLSRGKFG